MLVGRPVSWTPSTTRTGGTAPSPRPILPTSILFGPTKQKMDQAGPQHNATRENGLHEIFQRPIASHPFVSQDPLCWLGCFAPAHGNK